MPIKIAIYAGAEYNANKTTWMKITELIWLDNVIGKIESKHHCPPTDVEEVFANKPKVKKMHRGHFFGAPCLPGIWADRIRTLPNSVFHPQTNE